MKITGTSSYIKFDLENGYVLKAEGEMLTEGRFIVYKNSMKFWEEPHSDEKITEEQIEEIIREVTANMNDNTVQIIFE